MGHLCYHWIPAYPYHASGFLRSGLARCHTMGYQHSHSTSIDLQRCTFPSIKYQRTYITSVDSFSGISTITEYQRAHHTSMTPQRSIFLTNRYQRTVPHRWSRVTSSPLLSTSVAISPELSLWVSSFSHPRYRIPAYPIRKVSLTHSIGSVQ